MTFCTFAPEPNTTPSMTGARRREPQDLSITRHGLTLLFTHKMSGLPVAAAATFRGFRLSPPVVVGVPGFFRRPCHSAPPGD